MKNDEREEKRSVWDIISVPEEIIGRPMSEIAKESQERAPLYEALNEPLTYEQDVEEVAPTPLPRYSPTQEATITPSESPVSAWDLISAEAPGTKEAKPVAPPVREFSNPLNLPRVSPITERTGVLAEQTQAQRQLEREERARLVNKVLDNQYDPQNSFAQDAGDLVFEMDLARNKDFASMRNKFLTKYPQGDLKSVPVGDYGVVTVARKNPNEPYRDLGFLPTLVSGVGSEVTAGAAIGSMWMGPLGTALGAGMGYVMQRITEQTRGYEATPTASSAVGSALKEAVVAGTVDAATRKLFRVAGVSPRQVDVISAIQAQEAIAEQAMREFGLEIQPLVAGQVGGAFSRGMFLQVGATSGRVQEVISNQGRALYNFFMANADQINPEGLGDTALQLIARTQRDELAKLRTPQAVERGQATRTLQEGMRVWDETTRVLRNRAYEEAKQYSDGVIFDISEAQSAVAQYRRGYTGRGIEGEDVALPQGSNSVLEDVMRSIESLDPRLTTYTNEAGEVMNVVDQVTRIRRRLFDIKNDPNVDADVARQANELWSSITRTMENPTGNVTPQFQEAFLAARQITREREEVLRIAQVKNLLRQDNVNLESIAKRYTTPNHYTELNTLKEMLSTQPKTWETFREYMVNDLTFSMSPRNALRRLDNFTRQDPQALRLLMSEDEEIAIRSYLTIANRAESAPFRAAMEEFSSQMDRANAIINRSTPDQLAEFVNLAGGVDSLDAQVLRAAVYRDILRKSGADVRSSGEEIVKSVDTRKLINNISEWIDSGKLESIFSPKDIQMVKDIRTYAVAIGDSADIGGGMMAGAGRQKFIEGVTDLASNKTGKLTGVAHQLFSNDLTAFILSRPAVRAKYSPMPESVEGRYRRLSIYLNAAFNPMMETADTETDQE